MEILWRASDDLSELTRESLTDAGAEVEPRQGFEPITAILLIASVSVLAKAFSRLVRDSRFKGVMIDATKNPVEVREMPGWDRSQVLLITDTGGTFHTFSSEDGSADLLATVGASSSA
jgi:hypothetical protein